jgi:hypothetical protein
MKNTRTILLLLILTLATQLSAQIFNPYLNKLEKLKSTSPGQQITNDYLERSGAWPYGSSIAITVDSLRDLIFLGSGGAVLVLDGSDKNNPTLITNTIRSYGLVEDMYYNDQQQRLYLACGEGGFEIWDVQSPSNPVNMSRMEILYFDVETPVGHVEVKGNIAILECAWGYIHTVDVSDPYNPFQVAFNGIVGNPAHNIHLDAQGRIHATGQQYYAILGIDNSGNISTLGAREFIYGAGDVFGEDVISFVEYSGNMYILDLTLPGFPAWSITDVGGMTDIVVRNDYAYIVNDDGFQIWDASNVQNPLLQASIPIAFNYNAIFIAGNYAYLSSGPLGLQIFDITDASNPVAMGTFDTYSVGLGLFNAGNLIYLADAEDGLLIVDKSDLDYPVLLGHYPIPDGFMYQVEVRDNIAYTVCWTSGFRIIDVSDPSNPVELAVDDSYNVWKLDVGGDYAYVVEAIPNADSYLHIYDVSDPSNPVEVSSTQFPSTIYEVLYKDGYLYVANYENGLRILNVSDPAAPVEVAFFNYPDAFDVDIQGNILYVCAPGIADPDGGFYTVDITNPESPVELDIYAANGFTPFSVKVEGIYAYITDAEDVHILNIANPESISYLEEYRMPDFAYDLSVENGFIYISDAQAGLQILDNMQVIPVELISFTANVKNGRVELNWQTATETNNRGFEIQRKGFEWKKIGFVAGNGTVSELQKYSFIDKNVQSGYYFYRLTQIDFDGTRHYSEIVKVDNTGHIPRDYRLYQNFPNPFNPATVIKYSIPVNGNVKLSIFNSVGEKIITLVNEVKEAGNYKVSFDARNLSTGVYFYTLEAGKFISSKKMILLK